MAEPVTDLMEVADVAHGKKLAKICASCHTFDQGGPNRIAISMDGKGSWRDNVFVERLWRSVKYEDVYLKAYDSVTAARTSLGRYFDFYNRRWTHSAHGERTPDRACFDNLPAAVVA